MSNIKTNKDKKTSQDFNENFNQYSSEIEKEVSNLNRMLQEFASNGVVAQQIINDLEPVLAKLHLTIDSFTMNRPDKEKASNRGRLSLHFYCESREKFYAKRDQEVRLTIEQATAKLKLQVEKKLTPIKDKIQSFDLISFKGQQGNYVGEWVNTY